MAATGRWEAVVAQQLLYWPDRQWALCLQTHCFRSRYALVVRRSPWLGAALLVLSVYSDHKQEVCCMGRRRGHRNRVELAPLLSENSRLLLHAVLFFHKEAAVHMEAPIVYYLTGNRDRAQDRRVRDMDNHSCHHNMA